MWCVVHVRDRQEPDMEALVLGLLPKGLNARCFHLARDRRKKYEGQWHTVQEALFPGYVFIDTDQPDRVYRALKKAARPRLLFGDEEYVASLENHEAALLETIADKNGIVGISRVAVLGDGTIRYLSGPLIHVRDRVRKVNLHRRVAEIETSLLGRRQILYLGIEIEDMGG